MYVGGLHGRMGMAALIHFRILNFVDTKIEFDATGARINAEHFEATVT